MGSPEYLSAESVAELNLVSNCEPLPQRFELFDGALRLDVTLPPLAVAAITLLFAA